jgi:hypothetical protein
LAGASPEEAVDDFVDRARSTFECFLFGTAFGSGNAVGVEHSLTLYAPGQREPNIARLTTHDGDGEIVFQFAHIYAVVRLPDETQHGQYEVSTSFYQYRILDIDEGEIVIYDWAPAGVSTVRTPHMHIPAAGSVVLPQRAGSPRATRKTYLDDVHFPTGFIFLEDVALLLIREFRVDARRDDWEDVLAWNQKAAVQAWDRCRPDS